MHRRSRLSYAIGAAVLILAGSEASGDATSSTMTACSKPGNPNRYGIWSGSSWASNTIANIAGKGKWTIIRNAPTRNETAFCILGNDGALNSSFYNGSSWTGNTVLCSNSGSGNTRAFYECYEAWIGDLLIAYWNDTQKKIGYRTYSGSTLSAESLLTLPANTTVTWVALVARPQSDEILLLAANTANTLYSAVWSGNSFGSVTTLTSSLQADGTECFGAVYTTLSSDAVVAYGVAGSNNPRYRIGQAGTWTAEGSLPSIGGVAKWIRLVSDPTSNQVLFAALDDQKHINANSWSGSAWGTNSLLESNVYAHDCRRFDLAYDAAGTTALIVYNENTNTTVRYRTWNGSGWSSQSTGPDTGSRVAVVQMMPSLGSGSTFVGVSNSGNSYNITTWNGSAFSSMIAFENKMDGVETDEQFSVCTQGAYSLTPANIPYTNNFESSLGLEWTLKPRTNNATLTTFLGRFRNVGTQLVLNTTVGETYRLKFDFYAIDSWEGNDATNGPDYFNVYAGSTRIFHETFVHEWPADGMTYAYTYDQMGDYGFNSSYKDAIYRNVEATFTATSSTTVLSFQGAMYNPVAVGLLDDESWGIDNILVERVRFIDVSTASGFAVNTSTADTTASGLSWADLDGDGDLDAIVTGNSTSRLMLNNNAGASFTASTFGGGAKWGQAAIVDLDTDGDTDIWYRDGRLYQNNGSASLTDIGNCGMSSPANVSGTGAADVDGDGLCDVVAFASNGNWIGINQASNAGTLSQTNASSYGLNGAGNYGAGDYCSSADVNNDRYPDFFYHFGTGQLFVSNGAGAFAQNARGISVSTNSSKPIGSAWADYDNDGDLDLFVPRYDAGSPGYLWRNDVNWTNGTGNFTDVTTAASILQTPGMRSCCWGDYDNDGYLDLYITVGTGKNMLYHNKGNGTFERVGEGTDIAGPCQDAVFVDYDNDGDLDLAVTRLNGTTVLLQNRTNNNKYLKVRIVGRGPGGTNRAGIGTRVELWNSAGTVQLARRDVGGARGFGTEPPWLHFGGVDPTTSYMLKVYFLSRTLNNPYTVTVTPGTASTTIGGRTISQMVTVTEPGKSKVIQWAEIHH